ncbi:MAG: Pr6Pr family membrane protein [Actinomycetes bacterium]
MRDILARIVFGATALCVVVGVGLSVWLSTTATLVVWTPWNGHATGEFGSVLGRIFTVFTYFTILSNCIVGVVTLLLALNPGRRSSGFAVWRLISLIAIIITGVVYNVMLAPLYTPPGGWSGVSNKLEHIVVPILAVVGWLVFGPRLPMRAKTVWLALLFGAFYVVFTMLRGGLFEVAGQVNDHWYPYPFLDAARFGYGPIVINVVVLAGVYIGLGFAILGLDKVLPGPKPPKGAPDEGDVPVAAGASAD